MNTSTDERTVRNGERRGPALSAILSLLTEFLFVLIRMIFTYVPATIRLFYPQKEKNVAGEIVLITGAGHGIGKELAQQYGELGAIVVCVDINEVTNAETVSELTKTGVSAHGYWCDVSDRDKVFELRDKVSKEVGDVTILINNAGIMPCKPLAEQTPEVIKKQFDINVFGNFWTLQAFLPAMVKKNHGHVVALSSIAGISGQANLVPYCATKFAVRGMMEALALEHKILGSKIFFTTIYPHMTDTGLCKKPRLRFPEFFSILSPQETASAIVTAQRRNYRETTVPTYMLALNNTIRFMPIQASEIFVDFIDSGLDPHD